MTRIVTFAISVVVAVLIAAGCGSEAGTGGEEQGAARNA
jgi:hypothetical protein